jgi:hypothetical protein
MASTVEFDTLEAVGKNTFCRRAGSAEGLPRTAEAAHRWEGAGSGFTFNGDSIEGEVDLGQYFIAPFKGTRLGRSSQHFP